MRIARKDQHVLKKVYLAAAMLLTFILCVVLQLHYHDKMLSRGGHEITTPSLTAAALIPLRHYSFADEIVPVHDTIIASRLVNHLEKKKVHHGQYRLFLYRAKTWFPIIEPILKKHGIPNDFKYVAIIESNLSNVISPKGATGFWQFVPESGEKFGLEINSHIDERYHVEKSTEAACLYFKQAYKMFGNWTLAAASFNIGLGGILEQVKTQPGSGYFDMKFNRETAEYIYKLVATKEILSRPRFYGIIKSGRIAGATMRYNRVDVDYSIENLEAWATSHGVTLRMLKHYNPWLLGNSLPAKDGKVYKIKIPGANYSPDLLKELLPPHFSDSVAAPQAPDSLKISNFAVPDSVVTVK